MFGSVLVYGLSKWKSAAGALQLRLRPVCVWDVVVRPRRTGTEPSETTQHWANSFRDPQVSAEALCQCVPFIIIIQVALR